MTDTQIANNQDYVELWFIDAPAGTSDEDGGITKTFDTDKEAAHYLWHYVQGRIMHSEREDFLDNLLPELGDRYGASIDAIECIEDKDLARLLLQMNWADACKAVDWYFSHVEGGDWDAGYALTQYPGDDQIDYPADERLGSEVSLTSVFNDTLEHPLLDAAGIKMIRKDIASGSVYAQDRGEKTGPWYATLESAISIALTDMILELKERFDHQERESISNQSFFDRSYNDQMRLLRQLREPAEDPAKISRDEALRRTRQRLAFYEQKQLRELMAKYPEYAAEALAEIQADIRSEQGRGPCLISHNLKPGEPNCECGLGQCKEGRIL